MQLSVGSVVPNSHKSPQVVLGVSSQRKGSYIYGQGKQLHVWTQIAIGVAVCFVVDSVLRFHGKQNRA